MNMVLRRTANWIFAVIFGLILLCCLPAVAKAGWWLFTAPFFLAAGLALCALVPRIPEKYCTRVFAASLAVWALAIFGLGWLLRLDPQWDFGAIYHGALDLAANGRFVTYEKYLLESSNNFFITLVLCTAFKTGSVFGLSPDVTGILLNSLALAASVLFLYLALRKSCGAHFALVSAFICYFFVPMVWYAPVFYTDTLSMPFVMLSVWAAVCAKNADTYKKTVLWSAGFAAAVFIGYLVKGSTVIVLIAFVVAALLLGLYKNRVDAGKKSNRPAAKAALAACAAALVVFALLFAGWRLWFLNNPYLNLAEHERYRLPPAHYIMMGLEGDGGYNGPDYLLSTEIDSLALRKEANYQKINQRLSSYGVGGLLLHLQQKTAFTWADGTYFAPMKLCMYPKSEFWLHRWILPGSKDFVYFKNITTAAQGMLLCLLFGGALKAALCKKPRVDICFFARMAVAGLAILLTVWETRSRYLVSFAPLLVLLAADALFGLYIVLPFAKNSKKAK